MDIDEELKMGSGPHATSIRFGEVEYVVHYNHIWMFTPTRIKYLGELTKEIDINVSDRKRHKLPPMEEISPSDPETDFK